MGRPTGVTVIAVLSIIGAILSIIGGFGVLASGAILNQAASGQLGADAQQAVAQVDIGALGPLLPVIAVISIVSGVLSLIFAVGLFQMKRWGWLGTIVLCVVAVVLALPSVNIISIVLNAVIAGYLYTQRQLFA